LAVIAAQISEALAKSLGLMLGSEFAWLRAPIFDSLSFDPFVLFNGDL
jgi:hypothetical protein